MKEGSVSSVTLVITGDDLDPHIISKLMDVDPSQSWRKGDVKHLKSGRNFIYPWGGWKLFMDETKMELDLEEKICHWLSMLVDKKDSLDAIRYSSYKIILDCYDSFDDSISINLDSSTLYGLGSLGVDLTFNIFDRHDE